LKHYGKHLSQYERDEVMDYEMIYYLPVNSKNKGVGSYIKNELTCQDENPKEGTGPPYNHGFDNDQADLLYEAKDQIQYRYEIQKKLGRGAFGVVLKCYDHKNKEQCAIKILKNWKKLHKQGKIEIKILETLRDQDHENSKNIVRIKENFVFRSHVCIGFEMLSINLYQFIKNNDF
jgi:dual specificity tyrosine-phosphorylation-regulated kinase 2/3/4